MSLEDAVHRLVNVLGTMEPNPAVKEIIRQRDEALQEARQNASARKWAEDRRDYYRSELDRERHKTRSLRGVITRMKRKV